MQHLTVSVSILAFSSGIAALMYVHSLHKRYTLLYLKIFLKYLVVLNIGVFLNMILHYLITNVIALSDINLKVVIIFIVCLIGFFLTSMFTYLFLLLTRCIIGKNLNSNVKAVFFALITIASIAYSISITMYYSTNHVAFFIIIHKIAISIMSVISMIASTLLFYETYQKREKMGIRTLQIFSIVYFVFYLYQILAFLTPLRLMLLSSTIFLLALNVIPVFFLNSYLNEQKRLFIVKPEIKERIENFYKKKRLSRREMQIADFILAGKSNIQIKDELFISVFTVKKHISNIFMKLNINSRTQLIHQLLEEADWNSLKPYSVYKD